MAVLQGATRGGAEDGGDTKREKKSEAAALPEQKRKMGALHLVVMRWSSLVEWNMMTGWKKGLDSSNDGEENQPEFKKQKCPALPTR
ncbi:hypothetical protein MRB53_008895 [Persea americana]|uniref:Uncharacterized protein n=1 Tax=Persea americana TaxID=3435 RepID=A0ACC2LMK2_PERAE|nr:hypothetical protein MRB53_008895 [Persea americana]